MPFMSIKVTGFARFSLLEKLDAAALRTAADTKGLCVQKH